MEDGPSTNVDGHFVGRGFEQLQAWREEGLVKGAAHHGLLGVQMPLASTISTPQGCPRRGSPIHSTKHQTLFLCE